MTSLINTNITCRNMKKCVVVMLSFFLIGLLITPYESVLAALTQNRDDDTAIKIMNVKFPWKMDEEDWCPKDVFGTENSCFYGTLSSSLKDIIIRKLDTIVPPNRNRPINNIFFDQSELVQRVLNTLIDEIGKVKEIIDKLTLNDSINTIRSTLESLAEIRSATCNSIMQLPETTNGINATIPDELDSKFRNLIKKIKQNLQFQDQFFKNFLEKYFRQDTRCLHHCWKGKYCGTCLAKSYNSRDRCKQILSVAEFIIGGIGAGCILGAVLTKPERPAKRNCYIIGFVLATIVVLSKIFREYSLSNRTQKINKVEIDREYRSFTNLKPQVILENVFRKRRSTASAYSYHSYYTTDGTGEEEPPVALGDEFLGKH